MRLRCRRELRPSKAKNNPRSAIINAPGEQRARTRRLAAQAPAGEAFAEEEQRLFNTALDHEASANAIQAPAEGPPYVVPKSEKSDE